MRSERRRRRSWVRIRESSRAAPARATIRQLGRAERERANRHKLRACHPGLRSTIRCSPTPRRPSTGGSASRCRSRSRATARCCSGAPRRAASPPTSTSWRPTARCTRWCPPTDLLGADDEQLSDAERARRERTRTATRGVVDISVSDDGRTVLLPLGGKLYLVDRSTGRPAAPTAGSPPPRAIDPGGPVYDPQLSPDGTLVAFVRDGDLWSAAVGEAPRRLTHRPDGFEYGVADFAAQEELHRTRGFWWSPDGRRIVFQRSDLRAIQTLYVADARHNDRPPVPFRYPRAGTPNAVVDLGVIDARTPGEPRWLTWDPARYEYLVSVQWPARGPLSALVIDRAQQDLALLAFDVGTGLGTGLDRRARRARRARRSGHRRADPDRARRRVDQRRRRRAALARRRLGLPVDDRGERALGARAPRPRRRADPRADPARARAARAGRPRRPRRAGRGVRRSGAPGRLAGPARRRRAGAAVRRRRRRPRDHRPPRRGGDRRAAARRRPPDRRDRSRRPARAAQRRRAAPPGPDHRARDRRARRPHPPRRDHAAPRVRPAPSATRCCSRSTAARTSSRSRPAATPT